MSAVRDEGSWWDRGLEGRDGGDPAQGEEDQRAGASGHPASGAPRMLSDGELLARLDL